ncbi:multidrug resistance efflux transporter family protein [Leuconostoc lactis]
MCFVLFYVPLSWAVDYLPGWLISATWQLTIIFGVLHWLKSHDPMGKNKH